MTIPRSLATSIYPKFDAIDSCCTDRHPLRGIPVSPTRPDLAPINVCQPPGWNCRKSCQEGRRSSLAMCSSGPRIRAFVVSVKGDDKKPAANHISWLVSLLRSVLRSSLIIRTDLRVASAPTRDAPEHPVCADRRKSWPVARFISGE